MRFLCCFVSVFLLLLLLLWVTAGPFSSSPHPTIPPDLILLSSQPFSTSLMVRALSPIHQRDEAIAFRCPPPPSLHPSSLKPTDTLILCSGSVYRHKRPQRIGLEIIVLLSISSGMESGSTRHKAASTPPVHTLSCTHTLPKHRWSRFWRTRDCNYFHLYL